MSGAIHVQSPVQTPCNWGGVHTPITPACVCTPKGFAHAQGTQNKQATARPSTKPGQDHSAGRGSDEAPPPFSFPVGKTPERGIQTPRVKALQTFAESSTTAAPPHEKETTWL